MNKIVSKAASVVVVLASALQQAVAQQSLPQSAPPPQPDAVRKDATDLRVAAADLRAKCLPGPAADRLDPDPTCADADAKVKMLPELLNRELAALPPAERPELVKPVNSAVQEAREADGLFTQLWGDQRLQHSSRGEAVAALTDKLRAQGDSGWRQVDPAVVKDILGAVWDLDQKRPLGSLLQVSFNSGAKSFLVGPRKAVTVEEMTSALANVPDKSPVTLSVEMTFSELVSIPVQMTSGELGGLQ